MMASTCSAQPVAQASPASVAAGERVVRLAAGGLHVVEVKVGSRGETSSRARCLGVIPRCRERLIERGKGLAAGTRHDPALGERPVQVHHEVRIAGIAEGARRDLFRCRVVAGPVERVREPARQPAVLDRSGGTPATASASSSAATPGAWLTSESAEVISQSSIHSSTGPPGRAAVSPTGGRSISTVRSPGRRPTTWRSVARPCGRPMPSPAAPRRPRRRARRSSAGAAWRPGLVPRPPCASAWPASRCQALRTAAGSSAYSASLISGCRKARPRRRGRR